MPSCTGGPGHEKCTFDLNLFLQTFIEFDLLVVSLSYGLLSTFPGTLLT